MFIRFLIIHFLFLFITTNSYSQNSIGIRAGISSSNWISKTSVLTNTSERLTALTFGVPFEFQINDLFSIQPELEYITKGGIQKVDFSLIGIPFIAEQIIKVNYLEIPVLGKLSFRSGIAKLELLAGPALAYGLDGSNKYTETISGQKTSQTESIDFKKDSLSRTDFSLNLGLGISLPTGMNRLFFDFRYQIGLTNHAAPANVGTTSNLEVKENTFQFCLGILFPLASSRKGVVPMNPKK